MGQPPIRVTPEAASLSGRRIRSAQTMRRLSVVMVYRSGAARLAWCATRMTIGTAASRVCGLLSLPNTDYIILYVDVFLEV